MEKNRNPQDKRCIKTRRAIIAAMTELMSQKALSQITVREIADRALINRKTFYAHYDTIYDILNDIENEIIDKLISIVDSTDFSAERANPYPLFDKLTQLISTDTELFRCLLQASSHSHLLSKIKEVLKDHMMVLFCKYFQDDQIMPNYVLEFIASGVIAVYQQWYNSDRSQSLEDISQVVGELIFNGVNGIFEQKKKENQSPFSMMKD